MWQGLSLHNVSLVREWLLWGRLQMDTGDWQPTFRAPHPARGRGRASQSRSSKRPREEHRPPPASERELPPEARGQHASLQAAGFFGLVQATRRAARDVTVDTSDLGSANSRPDTRWAAGFSTAFQAVAKRIGSFENVLCKEGPSGLHNARSALVPEVQALLTESQKVLQEVCPPALPPKLSLPASQGGGRQSLRVAKSERQLKDLASTVGLQELRRFDYSFAGDNAQRINPAVDLSVKFAYNAPLDRFLKSQHDYSEFSWDDTFQVVKPEENLAKRFDPSLPVPLGELEVYRALKEEATSRWAASWVVQQTQGVPEPLDDYLPETERVAELIHDLPYIFIKRLSAANAQYLKDHPDVDPAPAFQLSVAPVGLVSGLQCFSTDLYSPWVGLRAPPPGVYERYAFEEKTGAGLVQRTIPPVLVLWHYAADLHRLGNILETTQPTFIEKLAQTSDRGERQILFDTEVYNLLALLYVSDANRNQLFPSNLAIEAWKLVGHPTSLVSVDAYYALEQLKGALTLHPLVQQGPHSTSNPVEEYFQWKHSRAYQTPQVVSSPNNAAAPIHQAMPEYYQQPLHLAGGRMVTTGRVVPQLLLNSTRPPLNHLALVTLRQNSTPQEPMPKLRLVEKLRSKRHLRLPPPTWVPPPLRGAAWSQWGQAWETKDWNGAVYAKPSRAQGTVAPPRHLPAPPHAQEGLAGALQAVNLVPPTNPQTLVPMGAPGLLQPPSALSGAAPGCVSPSGNAVRTPPRGPSPARQPAAASAAAADAATATAAAAGRRASAAAAEVPGAAPLPDPLLRPIPLGGQRPQGVSERVFIPLRSGSPAPDPERVSRGPSRERRPLGWSAADGHVGARGVGDPPLWTAGPILGLGADRPASGDEARTRGRSPQPGLHTGARGASQAGPSGRGDWGSPDRSPDQSGRHGDRGQHRAAPQQPGDFSPGPDLGPRERRTPLRYRDADSPERPVGDAPPSLRERDGIRAANGALMPGFRDAADPSHHAPLGFANPEDSSVAQLAAVRPLPGGEVTEAVTPRFPPLRGAGNLERPTTQPPAASPADGSFDEEEMVLSAQDFRHHLRTIQTLADRQLAQLENLDDSAAGISDLHAALHQGRQFYRPSVTHVLSRAEIEGFASAVGTLMGALRDAPAICVGINNSGTCCGHQPREGQLGCGRHPPTYCLHQLPSHDEEEAGLHFTSGGCLSCCQTVLPSETELFHCCQCKRPVHVACINVLRQQAHSPPVDSFDSCPPIICTSCVQLNKRWYQVLVGDIEPLLVRCHPTLISPTALQRQRLGAPRPSSTRRRALLTAVAAAERAPVTSAEPSSGAEVWARQLAPPAQLQHLRAQEAEPGQAGLEHPDLTPGQRLQQYQESVRAARRRAPHPHPYAPGPFEAPLEPPSPPPRTLAAPPVTQAEVSMDQWIQAHQGHLGDPTGPAFLDNAAAAVAQRQAAEQAQRLHQTPARVSAQRLAAEQAADHALAAAVQLHRAARAAAAGAGGPLLPPTAGVVAPDQLRQGQGPRSEIPYHPLSSQPVGMAAPFLGSQQFGPQTGGAPSSLGGQGPFSAPPPLRSAPSARRSSDASGTSGADDRSPAVHTGQRPQRRPVLDRARQHSPRRRQR